jgi:hypothetical protein
MKRAAIYSLQLLRAAKEIFEYKVNCSGDDALQSHLSPAAKARLQLRVLTAAHRFLSFSKNRRVGVR